MRKLVPFFAALLLIAGCAAPAQESSYRQVTAEEAIALMEKESGYIILDVVPEYRHQLCDVITENRV